MAAGGGLTTVLVFLLIVVSGARDAFGILKYLVLPRALLGIILAWYTLESIRYRYRFSTLAGAVTTFFCLAFAVHETLFGISWIGLSIYTDQNAILSSMVGAYLPLGITFGLVMTVIEEAMGVEQQFGKVWQASLDGMCLVDRNGIMRKVNNSYCRLMNKSRTELEG